MNNPWIEAMRPRTLPVSMAGVIAGSAVAMSLGSFRWLPAILCLIFAALAQISSNFANEYFDFKNGFDKKGREGFRRGVTEGDISPKAMLAATIISLAAACAVGLSLICWGGWILIPVGIVIAVFAMAYSAGPYPLSHHGLGDIAVVVFFGIVPVCLTAWLQATEPATFTTALPISIGIGLLSANVLIVNNYRDAEDDRSVGKHTTVVIFGRRRMAAVYLLDVIMGFTLIWLPAAAIMSHSPIKWAALAALPAGWMAGWKNYHNLISRQGSALNNVLKSTAILILFTSLLLFILAALSTGI